MHNIEYYTYKENVNRNVVQKDIDKYVSRQTYQEGGHGIDGIRWNEYTVCKSYDDAEKWIKEHDKGWYDCLAVRYQEPVQPANDSKIKELEQNVSDTLKEYNSRSSALYPETLTSELTTCKHCGSKLARKFLRSNVCPVCKTDLRPEYIQKSIDSAKTKHIRATSKLEEYKLKHCKKETKWLVKIEYHT